MHAARLSRPEFNALFLGQQRSPVVSASVESVHASAGQLAGVDTLLAYWGSKARVGETLPDLVVVPTGGVREVLAWLATYASHIRPVTAFCRILDYEDLAMVSRWLTPPSLDLASGFVGLILAEVLAGLEEPGRRGEALMVSAATGTLSFALARGRALYGGNSDDVYLSHRWEALRHSAAQRGHRSFAAGILDVIGALAGEVDDASTDVGYGRGSLAGACRGLARDGELPVQSAPRQMIDHAAPDSLARMRGPREERVATFERASHAIVAAPNGEIRQVAGFLIGYLASCIAPGTLAHVSLLLPFAAQVPDALLWYGACAGLAPEGQVLSELNGLGRRIQRELLLEETLVAAPRADISAMELELLSDGVERPGVFTRFATEQLAVELSPGVVITMPWPNRDRQGRGRSGMELPVGDRAALARELRAVSARLADIYSRLAPASTTEPEQQALFRDRDPKKGSRR
jgi:hypothetical protein